MRLLTLSAIVSALLLPLSLQGSRAVLPDDDTIAAEVGTFIPLEDGHRLQLFLEDHRLFARFVDEANVILEGEAESILFILDDPNHREDEWRTVLEPSEENDLYSSPRHLYGPPTFRARIIIRFPDRDPVSLTNVDLDLKSTS
ncbi:MAG: hypothetical protein R6V45_13840 [Oceanipulchritudo sp.]